MNYEAVIGLELHIQLATNSKLFSVSSASFGAQPNDHTNEIDLAYPGVLPVLNSQAVVFAIQLAKALGSKINNRAVFMRKNYFYPDLPKGYQISQLNEAIIMGGEVELVDNGQKFTVRINRGQLEEDAGKSVHDAFPDKTGIDLNRAGVPLIELVSEPDLRSASQAVTFMRYIHHLVRYLGIGDGNMQEGSFRCDANVSIRKKGSTEFNSRVELKNINSFRFVEQAINLEIDRQIEIVELGKEVTQETRLFDPVKNETRSMRSKEEANDYRYFPDPDLLPLNLSNDFIDQAIAQMPELPNLRKKRYQDQYELDETIADYLIQSSKMADYFDSVVKIINDGRLAANWIQGELAKWLNNDNLAIEQSNISAENLGELLQFVADNTISGKIAKKLLETMWQTGQSASQLIKQQNLQQVNDDGALNLWIDQVIEENPQQVAQYQSGQVKILGFLVGQVLKKSQGKANPKIVNQLLIEKIS